MARTWGRAARRRPEPSRATASILAGPGVLLVGKARSVSPPSPPKNAAVLIAARTGVARAQVCRGELGPGFLQDRASAP